MTKAKPAKKKTIPLPSEQITRADGWRETEFAKRILDAKSDLRKLK